MTPGRTVWSVDELIGLRARRKLPEGRREDGRVIGRAPTNLVSSTLYLRVKWDSGVEDASLVSSLSFYDDEGWVFLGPISPRHG